MTDMTIDTDDTESPETWWADHQNISFLLEYLNGPENTTDFFLTLPMALEIVEKPWKWTAEYRRAMGEYNTAQAEQEARLQALDATYKVVRFRFEGDNEVIHTGLTLDEAREHCNNSETHGEGWFDGYEVEA